MDDGRVPFHWDPVLRGTRLAQGFRLGPAKTLSFSNDVLVLGLSSGVWCVEYGVRSTERAFYDAAAL